MAQPNLRRLVELFDTFENVPIEVNDIRDAILEMGLQERIILRAEDADPSILRGVINRWIEHSKPYAEPDRVTLVVYSSLLDLEWQRIVCAKELIHVLDRGVEQSKTPDDVVNLMDSLLGRLSNEGDSISDFRALIDQIANFQCLLLLFPEAAREKAIRAVNEGQTTVEQVATRLEIPMELVQLVMEDLWPQVKDRLLNINQIEQNA